MFLLEFLNRISFFSVLTWSFYFVAVVCALILTNYSSPLTRRYRKTLIAVALSSIVLGTISVSSPIFLAKLNPSQSRLVPIDSLVTTQWDEPVSNPATEVASDEIRWSEALPYHFRFKLRFPEEFKRAVGAEGSELAYQDNAGNLRGFNAYTGINHWSIPTHAKHVLSQFETQKRLFVLDESSTGQLRVSCFDLANPSLLWQRYIPNSKEGSLNYDSDSQSLLISAGSSGVWSLKAGTGEIYWKRPEIYSKTKPLISPKHVLVFEPVVANRAGSWYFLDISTGRTLQKIPHVYGDIQAFLPREADEAPLDTFVGQVDSENFFSMNHSDLSQVWSFHASETVKLTRFVDKDRYLLLYESSLLEMRSLKDNSVIYQKKLSGVQPNWIKLSPDLAYIAIPSIGDDGNPGVSFFSLDTGDYQSTARTSEAIKDLLFFGDWMYLFSDTYMWALKK